MAVVYERGQVGPAAAGAAAAIARCTFETSWWIRVVRIEDSAGDGVLRVRVAGPLGLAVPPRVKRRAALRVKAVVPIGALVRVTSTCAGARRGRSG